MNAKILLFASLKDRIGMGELEINLNQGTTVAGLKELLTSKFSEHAHLIRSALVSVNQEFAFDGDFIPEGAEIGLFPPVSGGTDSLTICRVTVDVIDLDALVSQISTEKTGAVCIFTGIVRGKTTRGDSHDTALLEYEAYVPMAQTKMEQVAGEIRERWPTVEGIIIVQRIGRLAAGTPTVIIACSASHRDTGVFEAARYGIDRLKEIVPIWKKEIGPLGEEWVEGDYIPKRDD
jgi:molybdopterin converting factor subunit 1